MTPALLRALSPIFLMLGLAWTAGLYALPKFRYVIPYLGLTGAGLWWVFGR